MKFSPTYGATPATVGIMPRYNAVNPPSFRYICFIVAHIPGIFPASLLRPLNDAVWIDRRVRTMSSGYVTVTDVMPASAPQHSLSMGVRGAPGECSNACHVSTTRPILCLTHFLVDVVAAELYCTVWHNANAIRAITSHQASEAFFLPHLLQCFAYAHLVLIPTNTLYLQQNLEPFKRTDYRS